MRLHPTLLTFFRVILTPFLIAFFYLPFYWSHVTCVIIFIFAAVTDLFDGFLARYFEKTTKLGTFLDPVADKIMIVSSLILITDWYHVWWITLPSIVSIVREIIISSLREWIAETKERRYVSVSLIGKWKTFFQMVSLIGMLSKVDGTMLFFSTILLYFSVFLTYWSIAQYFRSIWNFLR
ncbi:CDP-diacylglycerol--glycerol-3-phosphate 3-phosphatidyltransferase [Candidatus Riesia pediculischaeffi]|uniref:CDP-diacylglycerol--glycerol-3-phosphate 3-phosphatidyltransferase n=2 Tax=Candidatus Riesia pediculischaeffi TaxID=428411 RepID=A0A1V0HJZ2_9ENTR|nr:CDP-diacylglycerol--glycerol-3-phosphate 3-phosphatidyltransferase [Candidatus Riesia pediculischaeffi]ARC53157.1 CDP-diacylglycerol--glycerol-3-phosphate 3-phosphatidyltransferase [Candidatus Riesia pediculischaeffi]KIE64215.1 CDP-diacylglycerol--glycerol-3-phosphate 3-phosphatidyltransferase [Candidatus Riesia pediculischaeffi PTSU]